MQNKQIKQRFTLRKNKKYKNLVSVGLGLFIATAVGISGNEAHASETTENSQIVRTENPATNLPEAQPKTTEALASSLQKTGEKAGVLDVEVSKTELNSAVDNARNNGLKTEKESDKTLPLAKTPEEATKNNEKVTEEYNKQITEINKTTEEYKQKLATHKVEVTKITTENTKLEEQYKKDVEKYNQDVITTNQYNKQVQEKYDRELAKFNQDVARINKENENAKTEYEKAYQNYLTNVNKITEENKALQEEFTKKSEANKQDNAKIEKENADKKAEYEKQLAKYNAEKQSVANSNQGSQEEYNRQLAEYNKLKEEYDRKIENIKNNNSEQISSDGISIYGDYDYTKTGSIDFYKNFTVTADSNLTKTLQVKDFIGFHNDTDVVKVSGNYNIENDNSTWTLSGYNIGDKYKITNVATLKDGRKISAIVEIKKLGRPVGAYKPNSTETVVPQKISIAEYGDTGVIDYGYYNHTEVSQTFKFVDDNNNPVNLLFASVVTDVDWGQASKFEYNRSSSLILNPLGSGLVNADGVLYDNTKEGADNLNDIPKGSFLIAGYGDSLTYSHQSRYFEEELWGPEEHDRKILIEGHSAGVSFQLFGKTANLEVLVNPPKPTPPTTTNEPTAPVPPTYKEVPTKPVAPKLKEIPNKPTEPNYNPLPEKPVLEKFKELPPKPTTPNYKELPKTPAVPTVKYHYADYDVEPVIEKEVKNQDGENINNNLVNKQSIVNWELKTGKLPADREEITTYQITDTLPTGFEINIEKTKELSKGFTVDYNKETHTATFTAVEELIKTLNKDRTKEILPIYPTASGTVVNDGATYENNFKLEVNKYNIYSNKVVVYTPGNDPKKPRPPYPNPEIPGNPTPNDNLIKPEKHNTNKDGVVIDGKTLLPQATNYYKLTWDLDQYKGIKTSKEDIKKGFFYLEDYPEEAVTLQPEKIVLTDNKGQAVKGIKVEAFDNLDTATEKVKEILSKAKITPKGAFQLFTAENPEQFFNDYVVTGNTITITSPMVIKENFSGEYKNKAYQIDFGNGYETETVVNNVTPPSPEKHNTNKDGVVIDGKTLLPNTVNYYKLTWDLDQYANISVEKEDIKKGFFYIDDYPEEALELNENGVTLVDSKGQAVKGIKVEAFDNLDTATEKVKEILSKAKITPKGAFQLFTAENPEQFFNDYVVTGNTITITTPMTVKEAFNGEYQNKAYQIDFGFGYETEIVVNNVPKLDPKKDVVVDVTNKDKSLDGQEIELGKVFNYHLIGAKIPANRGDEITQYGFYDDYDQKGDQYDGVYLVFATTDIKLKDKSVIKQGTEVTKYTTQVLDTENGVVNIEVDKDFLSKVSTESEFQLDLYLQMKRISSGEFENTYENTINGAKTKSNTVKTRTPEPKKPTPPTPVVPEKPEEPAKPTPPAPVVPETPKEKTLPKTSVAKGNNTTQENGVKTLVLTALALGTLTLVRKRKVK